MNQQLGKSLAGKKEHESQPVKCKQHVVVEKYDFTLAEIRIFRK